MTSRLLHFNESIHPGTVKAQKEAFDLYLEFLHLKKILGTENPPSPFILQNLTRDERKNLINMLMQWLANEKGKREEQLSSFITHLKGNWITACLHTDFFQFTATELARMVKAAKRTRGQMVSHLAKKRENRKEEVVLEMVEATRQKYFEEGRKSYQKALITHSPDSEETFQSSGPGLDSMMSYVAYAVCHDWGCRSAQLVLTEREKQCDGIILAGHVHFLVGVGETTEDGVYSGFTEMTT
jgi:hypothetical protein